MAIFKKLSLQSDHGRGQLGRWKAVGASDERPKDAYPCWIYEHRMDRPEEPSSPADQERQLYFAPRAERLKAV